MKNKSLAPADFNGSVQGAKGDIGPQGPKGDNGTNGTNGTDATVNGVAAGGDLTGSYPNPLIGAGTVTGAKVDDGTLGTADFSASIPAAHVTRNSNQLLQSNIPTAVAFNSEQFDTGAIHENLANNIRLTVRVDGIYAITARVEFASNPNGNRRIFVSRESAFGDTVTIAAAEGGGGTTHLQAATQARLEAGQALWLGTRQTSGSNLDLIAAEDTPEFSMTWLAPGP